MSNQINLINYCTFYLENQRHPKPSTNSYEKRLSDWRVHMRYASVFKALPNTVPLSAEEMARVLAIDPKFLNDDS